MTYNRNKKMRIREEDKVVPELKADVTSFLTFEVVWEYLRTSRKIDYPL